ncbi:MAG: ABC transporter substrate-binding protein, partial [Chloroflexi bacterium]|nr:ABC transporter substrate-binding protein [Chloroflexota bacterium]
MAGTSDWARRGYSRRTILRAAGIAGAGLAGAALIGCGSSEETAPATATAAPAGATTAAIAAAPAVAEPKRGGIYNSYIIVDPTSLDPYANLSYTTKGFAAHVYSRLFRLNAQPDLEAAEAKVIPDIAESAESADGISWTVKLKKGVKFHNVAPVNGREVTSADVKYSWERPTAPESASNTVVPKGLAMEVVDDYTLSFKLAEPSATFLDFLSDANALWIMPTEADGGFDPIAKPIGSGPWVMKSYTPASEMSYDRHTEYHVEGRPYMDGIRNAIIREYANYKAQFDGGNLHVLAPVAADVIGIKKQSPDVQWVGNITLGLLFVYFSGADMDPDAPWRDERYRQAVSHAIDRPSLFDLFYNVKELGANGFAMSPDWNNIMPRGYGSKAWLDPLSAAQGPSSKFFNYDPAEAKKLLAAVGNADQPFTYQYTSQYGGQFTTYAEAISNWISEVGLKPQTEVQDYSSKYITQTFRGNFNGLTTGYQTPFPEPGNWVNRMFGDDPANNSRVHDPKIDDLNAKQRIELDPKQRAEYFYEIQRISDSAMYYVPTPGAGGTG